MKKKPKTIPVLGGILILLIAGILGIFLINKSQTFFLKANQETIPQQVKITNVSDIFFTVSWVTQSASSGFIAYGESPSQINRIVLDDRETDTEAKESFFTHYVTVKNLKPSTKYFFKVGSAGKTFDNGGKPYEITTGPTINLPLPAADTAYGIVLDSKNNPAKGAIVYLSMANTTPLSSMVKSDGSWIIPLSTARNLTLTSYSSYDRSLQIEEIFVQGGNLGTTTVITTTKNDSPVPTLTLGQNYDFRQQAFENSPTPSPEPGGIPFSAETPTPAKRSGFSFELPISSPSPTGNLEQKLEILAPAEGEKINTSKPEFIGVAPPGEVLQIIVESETSLTGQVVIGENGRWTWSPPVDLSVGDHHVTVVLKNKNGAAQKVTRSFTVLAAGQSEIPSFNATPSGQLTIIPTLTSAPATPTAKPSQPPTGNLTNTLIFITIGLVFIIFGLYQLKTI